MALSAGCDPLALLCGVVMLDNEGWSLYGAQRSQLVATGGKWEGAENGSDKRKTTDHLLSSSGEATATMRGVHRASTR
jgi:hypothetical protein